MKSLWWKECRYIAPWAAMFILIGLLSGYFFVVMAAGAVIYAARQFLNLVTVHRWLHSRDSSSLPDVGGVWGEVYYRLHANRRRRDEQKRRMRNIIDDLRQLMERLPDAVMVLDGDGNIQGFNQKAGILFELRGTEDVGRSVFNYIRSPEFRRYFGGRNPEQTVVCTAPSTVQVKLELRLTSPDSDGRVLLIARDVTRLDSLERIRKDFVANVSHELKTPLTVIKGYIETMEDFSHTLDPKWHKPVSEISRQTDRMRLIVEDLLQLARLESDAEAPVSEEIVLADMLSSIRVDVEAVSAGGHPVGISVPANIRIRGSYKEIHSALSNIVENAVSHTPAGTRLEVDWSDGNPGGILCIRDDGPGIPAQHLPRLTERFYRVSGASSDMSKGSGLGLAIAKHAVRRHEGRLEIESEPGKGTAVRIWFPDSRIGRKAPAPALSEAAG